MEIHNFKQCRLTLMERILQQAELIEGFIQSEKLPKLFQNLYPELPIDKNDIQRLIQEHDKNGSGNLDFDSVTKILLSFLLKQSAETDSYSFAGNGNFKSQDATLSLTDLIVFCNL